MNATLHALAEQAATHPFARKRLVAATLGEAREVLRTLARTGGAWIGFEPVTPWILASEIASPILAELELRLADEFEQLALLDEAMDGVAADAPAFATALAQGPGLRTAVAAAIHELRHTGIDADLLARTPLRDAARRDALVNILRRYEAALADAHAVDAAGVFRVALQSLATGLSAPASAIHLILAGPDRRGLAGRLLDHLVATGAIVLPVDPVMGLEAPAARFAAPGSAAVTPLSFLHAPEAAPNPEQGAASVDVFAGGSLMDELREVLRRVMKQGLAWDEVEIIATDAMAYGAALDALARTLGIDVSYAQGLPVSRTRPGRTLRAYLQWVRDDLPTDVVLAMFERGDIASSAHAEVSGVALARRLRRLRIGRGRSRWEAALDAAERAAASEAPPADDERAPDEAEAARERERAEVAALCAVLRPVLAATPALPDRLRTTDVPVRPADLARGALALLEHVVVHSTVDATALSRMQTRLTRIAATLARPTTLEAAVALLDAKLEVRVPAPDEPGTAPWNASGGRIHVSDLRHGGWSGRRATFIVGLDAGRFPGAGVQDAILSDEDRFRLTTGQDVPAMPTSAERVAEARHAFAALLARLRGNVTLSWPAWEAAEARALAPASELLQAWRIRAGDVTRDYQDLQRGVGVATAVPRSGDAHVDASDVWLAALSDGGTLREGEAAIRAAFPGLDRGLEAASARASDAYTAWHGRIAARPELDARDHASLILSASRLEALGTCPLRYFMRTVLRVRPQDDVELDPDRWLSALQRGSMLHSVYEKTLRRARDENIALHDERFERLARETLDHEIEVWTRLQPPPGGAVFRGELDALTTDMRAFVQMVREDAPDWIDLELRFGRYGATPFTLALPGGGGIRVSGAIDRVDRLPDGRLRIVDYKTGSSYSYGQHDLYRGGRRLQHVLYAAVAGQLLDAEVARVEYHFPTYREQTRRVPYDTAGLHDGLHVVDDLLSLAASGTFHPTDDPDDCKFCDYARVCRVQSGRRGRVPDSEPAAWTKRSLGLVELTTLRTLRGR